MMRDSITTSWLPLLYPTRFKIKFYMKYKARIVVCRICIEKNSPEPFLVDELIVILDGFLFICRKWWTSIKYNIWKKSLKFQRQTFLSVIYIYLVRTPRTPRRPFGGRVVILALLLTMSSFNSCCFQSDYLRVYFHKYIHILFSEDDFTSVSIDPGPPVSSPTL